MGVIYKVLSAVERMQERGATNELLRVVLGAQDAVLGKALKSETVNLQISLQKAARQADLTAWPLENKLCTRQPLLTVRSLYFFPGKHPH